MISEMDERAGRTEGNEEGNRPREDLTLPTSVDQGHGLAVWYGMVGL